MDLSDFDRNFGGKIMGIDEAGRGPLAGPVVVAAVIIENYEIIPNFLRDSKKLSFRQRNFIYEHLKKNSHFSLSIIDNKRIDQTNILAATLLGMRQVIRDLNHHKPDHILIDGNILPIEDFSQIKYHKIIKGDNKSAAIAAASVMAKVTRDEIMKNLSLSYPEYQWQKNMGYGTKKHLEMIEKFGITEYHRKSFKICLKNVKNAISLISG